MATIVGDWADVDGAAKVVVASVVGNWNGSDVEVDAVAASLTEDPVRVTAQAPLAAPSANATIATSGAGRFHHGRFRTCLPRMVTTLAERAGQPADGWACEHPHFRTGRRRSRRDLSFRPITARADATPPGTRVWLEQFVAALLTAMGRRPSDHCPLRAQPTVLTVSLTLHCLMPWRRVPELSMRIRAGISNVAQIRF
jgi:hypothetical protein